MKESKENISPQRPSLLKNAKALLQYSRSDSNQRFRSKSVAFNKAVMINLMEQSSQESDQQVSFDAECEIIVKFNMQKVYFLTLNAYMDDTIISSESGSECMELKLDSATNFDDAPKKSFLCPAGMGIDLDIDLGLESDIKAKEQSMGEIPLDSVNSLCKQKSRESVPLSVRIAQQKQQQDPFLKQISSATRENQKIDRFEAKNLSYIQSCFNEFSLFCKINNYEIINSTMYAITIRILPPVFFKWLLCCTQSKGGMVIRLENEPGRKLLRLINTSGNTSKFFDVRNKIKCRLWSKGLVSLSETEALTAAVEMKNQRILELKKEIEELKRAIRSKNENETVLEIILGQIIIAREDMFNIITHNYNGPAKPQNMIDKPLYGDLMMEIYRQHTKNDQKVYTNKRKQIVESWSIEECFEYLQVEEKYRLKDGEVMTDIPYSKAIHEFEKLNYAQSPLDKLNCITKGYQAMKQCCESSKLALEAMDTILPLLIFIILRSDIDSICANVKIVQHFMNVRQQYKTADKMVTNVYVALEYIAVSWDEKKKEN